MRVSQVAVSCIALYSVWGCAVTARAQESTPPSRELLVLRRLHQHWRRRPMHRHLRHPTSATGSKNGARAIGAARVNSLNRLRDEMFQCCAFNHSAISPFRINYLQAAVDSDRPNCVRPSKVPRSLTAISSIAAAAHVPDSLGRHSINLIGGVDHEHDGNSLWLLRDRESGNVVDGHMRPHSIGPHLLRRPITRCSGCR